MGSKVHLFDFDGTLVDSMPVWGGEMLRMLDERQVRYPADIIKILTPLGYRGTAEYFSNELGIKEDIDGLIEEMHVRMKERYTKEVELKPTVKEYLTELSDKGERLAVLTASPHPTVDLCLEKCGVAGLFEQIWTCDDFGKIKTDPTIYTDAAERLGVGISDVRFYDDNLSALETARAAGAETVGVYDESSEKYKDEIKATVDFYVIQMIDAAAKPTDKKNGGE